MSKSRPNKAPRLDAATLLRLLLDWLRMQLHSELPKQCRLVDPHLDSRVFQVQLQDLNTRERVYEEIIRKVEELESGSDPNKAGDFLGADDLPPIIETMGD